MGPAAGRDTLQEIRRELFELKNRLSLLEQRLEAAAPDAALRFHEGMAAILGRRLTRTNRLVRFLAN